MSTTGHGKWSMQVTRRQINRTQNKRGVAQMQKGTMEARPIFSRSPGGAKEVSANHGNIQDNP
jgi:hypothetical protein